MGGVGAADWWSRKGRGRRQWLTNGASSTPKPAAPLPQWRGASSPAWKLPGAVQELLHPLAHLDQALRAVGGGLLDRIAATDRLHSDPDVEVGPVSRWFLMGGSPFQGAVSSLKG